MEFSINILELLKKDEKKAFRLLFERYYDNLLLYSFRILNDLEAAEDIVQDCFVRLWNTKRLYTFAGDLERFIFKMVKNRALLYLKENQKRNDIHAFFSEENNVSQCDFGQEAYEKSHRETEALYNAVGRLPEKCRKVFLMACLNDRTYKEIAGELGVSINTVKTQMKTALKFLRENLREDAYLMLLFFLTQKH